MTELQTSQGKALRLLKAIYDAARGRTEPVFVTELARDAGLTEEDSKAAWRYLRDKRLIDAFNIPYTARINAAGIDTIENAQRHPDQPIPKPLAPKPPIPAPLARIVHPSSAPAKATVPAPEQYDCFVSYASEDRPIVQLLVEALEAKNIDVWWDKGQITLGDRLSEKIDQGLSHSRYGVVIISPSFVVKEWTEAELRALLSRAINRKRKVILPVLVNMNHDKFAASYPLLADIVSTTFNGNMGALVDEIIRAIE
jgi:hypothetical protein